MMWLIPAEKLEMEPQKLETNFMTSRLFRTWLGENLEASYARHVSQHDKKLQMMLPQSRYDTRPFASGCGSKRSTR
jgi:hypothetical protein